MIASIGPEHNPVFGILSIPFMGPSFMQTFGMNTRDVLAGNFNKLREACPKLYSLKDITKAGGGSNGTLGRISAKQSAATVDTVETLAQVYGLEAWQLLVPTLEATRGAGDTLVIRGLPVFPHSSADQNQQDVANSGASLAEFFEKLPRDDALRNKVHVLCTNIILKYLPDSDPVPNRMHDGRVSPEIPGVKRPV